MSRWPPKIRFAEPLREARVRAGTETYVSPGEARAQHEERYRAGFEAGQKSLSEEIVRQRAQLAEVQHNIFRSIERVMPNLAARCEKDLVTLAMEAARQVVQEMPICAVTIEAVVRNGIAELQDTAEYQVRLNPEDLALLVAAHSPALPAPEDGKVRFVADAAVPRAGCLIHTRHGAIELNREKMFRKAGEAAAC